MDEFDELEKEILTKKAEIEEIREAIERLEKKPVVFLANKAKVEQLKAGLMKRMSECQVRISEITKYRKELREKMREESELKEIEGMFTSPIILEEILAEKKEVGEVDLEKEPLAIFREV